MSGARSSSSIIARALVEARLTRRACDAFPGTVPDRLDDAYAVQLEAIALWPDAIAGWKVGRLSDDLAQRFGCDRFIGPVFHAAVAHAAREGCSPFAMFAGGSAAFEAEYVAFVSITADGSVGISHVTTGIEVASSPVATLPGLGALASVADLGNNAGQIIGGPVPLDFFNNAQALSCETRIDDAAAVFKTAAALPGGPATAFAFAVEQAGRLGLPLQAGQFVSTGAVTGMHAVTPGQVCTADFGEFGRIGCDVVALDSIRA